MTDSCFPRKISEDLGSDTVACLCDTDLCNIGEMTAIKDTPETKPQLSRSSYITNFTTTDSSYLRPSLTTTLRTPVSSTSSPTSVIISTQRSRADRVKCHQCGSLFSGDASAPSCDNFDVENSRKNYCDPGEACLWYSWYLSDTQVSVIRECLSTSILLGSIEDPLVVTPGCTVKDISEDGTKAEACLCDSDLCNDNAPVSTISRPQSNNFENNVKKQTSSFSQTSTTRRPRTTSTAWRQPVTTTSSWRQPVTTTSSWRQPQTTTSRQWQPQSTSRYSPPRDNDLPGLQCYSCGSLFNPDDTCSTFNPGDERQVKTCGAGEACLYYSYYGAPGEPETTLRECFSTSVLLGPIESPLLPSSSCVMKDITEDSDSRIMACLCQTDNCNIGPQNNNNNVDRQTTKSSYRQTTTSSYNFRRQQQTTTQSAYLFQQQTSTAQPRISLQRTTAPASRFQSSSGGCPRGYDLTEEGCVFISSDRVGWVEARKKCSQSGGELLSLPTQELRLRMERIVMNSINRRREEFWLSGNDIEDEGVWLWSGRRYKQRPETVPGWGWSNIVPYNSYEENCLSWSLETGDNYWRGSSCCNNLRYICQA